MTNEGGADASADTGSAVQGFVVAPIGVFPGVVGDLVRATADYVNAMCCSSINESPTDHGCSQEELWVALGSMERLVPVWRSSRLKIQRYRAPSNASQPSPKDRGLLVRAMPRRRDFDPWRIASLRAEHIPFPDACLLDR